MSFAEAVGLTVLIIVGLASAVILISLALPHSCRHNHRRMEAKMNLRRMFDGAVSYHASTGRFPISTPLTPATSACRDGDPIKHGVRSSDWRHPSWRALHFGPLDPFRYQYQFVSDGAQFTARALGDLDCDGVLSTFERVGVIDAEGNVNGGAGIFKKAPTE